MATTYPMELENSAITAILGTLAKILAKGLSSEQRATVLTGLSVELNPSTLNGEVDFFQALWDAYSSTHSVSYALDLARRIQATQSFYQDVGADLDHLRYLIKVSNLEGPILQAPYVFALLPFDREFLAIYESAVKPALEELGCHVERADEVTTIDSIVSTIFAQIARATFLVADTTGKNPNVFYELGYAHALGKKVILIIQSAADLPFDISGLKHITYMPGRPNVLSQEIKKVAHFLLNQFTPVADKQQ